MKQETNSLMKRLLDRVFPRMPDFYGLMNEQHDMALETMQVFSAYLQSGDAALAQEVRDLEHRADQLKFRNIEVLNSSFSTPMDREDLYDAISGIDHLINFAKTTVYELHMFEIASDECIVKLVEQLTEGVEALRHGFALLATDPAGAEPYAQHARKAERNMKKIYRSGLVELLDKNQFKEQYAEQAQTPEDVAMDFVVYIMKKREIYRHLSHAADRLARVSELLRDIIVKLV